MTAKRKLTDKQQRFVDEYLVDLNATQAAIRAGYSEKTADSIAVRLVRNCQVAEAIEKAKAKRAKRVEVTADQVIGWLIDYYKTNATRIPKTSFGGPQEVDENGKPAWRMVDATAAGKALDMLNKHLGNYERDKKLDASLTFSWQGATDPDESEGKA